MIGFCIALVLILIGGIFAYAQSGNKNTAKDATQASTSGAAEPAQSDREFTSVDEAKFYNDMPGMFGPYYTFAIGDQGLHCFLDAEHEISTDTFACGYGYSGRDFLPGYQKLYWSEENNQWALYSIPEGIRDGDFRSPKEALNPGEEVSINGFTCQALGGDDFSCQNDDKNFQWKNGKLSFNGEEVTDGSKYTAEFTHQESCGVDKQAPEILDNIDSVTFGDVSLPATESVEYYGDSNYDPCNDMSYAFVYYPGVSGARGTQVMLFKKAKYIGTAFNRYMPMRVTDSTSSSVTISYPNKEAIDRDKPILAEEFAPEYRKFVTGHWEGDTIVWEGEIPE